MKLEPVAWIDLGATNAVLPDCGQMTSATSKKWRTFTTPLYAISDGYVVIPVEISGKMWSAGRDALREVIDSYEEALGYELRSAILDRGPEKIHEAMIAAKAES